MDRRRLSCVGRHWQPSTQEDPIQVRPEAFASISSAAHLLDYFCRR